MCTQPDFSMEVSDTNICRRPATCSFQPLSIRDSACPQSSAYLPLPDHGHPRLFPPLLARGLSISKKWKDPEVNHKSQCSLGIPATGSSGKQDAFSSPHWCQLSGVWFLRNILGDSLCRYSKVRKLPKGQRKPIPTWNRSHLTLL